MPGRGLCVFFLCWTVARAAAQEESPEVRSAHEHFTRAEQHYYNERPAYALALNEYRESYRLMSSVDHPNAALILFNIARCYVRLSQEREAIDTYRRFLAEAPESESTAQVRADARTELEELEARQSLRGGGGGLSPIPFIVGGVGAAALVASAITGGLALAANDAAEAGCMAGVCPRGNEARNQEATVLANATDGLWISGAAVLATAVILFLVLPPENAPAAVAACAQDGCMLFARGAF